MMSFFNACRMFGLDRFGGRAGLYNRFGQNGMHPGFMVFGLLIAILVVVGIVLLIRALMHTSKKKHGIADHVSTTETRPFVSTATSQAVQILDERLARGEINTDEYRRRKDELLRP